MLVKRKILVAVGGAASVIILGLSGYSSGQPSSQGAAAPQGVDDVLIPLEDVDMETPGSFELPSWPGRHLPPWPGGPYGAFR